MNFERVKQTLTTLLTQGGISNELKSFIGHLKDVQVVDLTLSSGHFEYGDYCVGVNEKDEITFIVNKTQQATKLDKVSRIGER